MVWPAAAHFCWPPYNSPVPCRLGKVDAATQTVFCAEASTQTEEGGNTMRESVAGIMGPAPPLGAGATVVAKKQQQKKPRGAPSKGHGVVTSFCKGDTDMVNLEAFHCHATAGPDAVMNNAGSSMCTFQAEDGVPSAGGAVAPDAIMYNTGIFKAGPPDVVTYSEGSSSSKLLDPGGLVTVEAVLDSNEVQQLVWFSLECAALYGQAQAAIPKELVDEQQRDRLALDWIRRSCPGPFDQSCKALLQVREQA